jgi:hypothetical protein
MTRNRKNNEEKLKAYLAKVYRMEAKEPAKNTPQAESLPIKKSK